MRLRIDTMILMSFVLQAMTALVGAFNLYVAIDCFLRGAPILSALMTVFAFWQGCLFVEQAQERNRLRHMRTEV